MCPASGRPACGLRPSAAGRPDSWPAMRPPCLTRHSARLLPPPKPQVVVAEAAPRYDGHTMARQLADAGVQTTLIADSAVFAMMARVNKVRRRPCQCVGPRPLPPV
jgi:hypothetical protein